MNITDTQVSLLAGFAFAVFYTFAGIPIAWLADQKSRRVIIMVGVALWSLMTAVCGLTKTFWQLFLARIGVGVGEASLTPSAYSMIADCFPPERLGRAIGVYMGGTSIGSGLALVLGGYVIARTADLPQLVLPVVGALQPWQLAFMIAAIPGLLVILLLLTIKEPRRRGRVQLSGAAREQINYISPGEAITFAVQNWKTYLPVIAGFSIIALTQNAVLVWTPTMFIRTYDWNASNIGYFFGMFLIVFGPLGAIGGGWITDRFSKRGYIDAPIRVTIITSLLLAVTATLMPLMPTASLSLALLALLTMFLFVLGSVVPTAFQLVTPNQFRAQISAFTMFVVNLAGLGLGPTVVALITDYGFGDPGALRFSISIVSALITPVGALIFWLALRPYAIQRKNMMSEQVLP